MALTKNTSQGTFYFEIDEEETHVEMVLRYLRLSFMDNLSFAVTSCEPSRSNGNSTGKLVVKITHIGDDEYEIGVKSVEEALDRCRYVFEDAQSGKLDQLALFDVETGEIIGTRHKVAEPGNEDRV